MSSEAYFPSWCFANMTEIGIQYYAKLLDIPGVSVTISANLGERKKVSFDFCYPTNDNNLNFIVRNALKMLTYTFFLFPLSQKSVDFSPSKSDQNSSGYLRCCSGTTQEMSFYYIIHGVLIQHLGIAQVHPCAPQSLYLPMSFWFTSSNSEEYLSSSVLHMETHLVMHLKTALNFQKFPRNLGWQLRLHRYHLGWQRIPMTTDQCTFHIFPGALTQNISYQFVLF